MGREFSSAHMDKKPNGVVLKSNHVSHDVAHVAPRISEDTIEEKEYEKECTTEDSVENSSEIHDVLGVKGTNFGADLPEQKNCKPGTQKSSDDKNSGSTIPKSGGIGNVHAQQTVPLPCALASDKHADVNKSPTANTLQSPTATKTSPSNSSLTARKLSQSENKHHLDEDDSWSVVSSYPLLT
uniref:Protein WVD2-like 1 n=1 Tax=Rhizophora mucronata TaxID=61149 RepID=A0A2P2K7F1_RHIMU